MSKKKPTPAKPAKAVVKNSKPTAVPKKASAADKPAKVVKKVSPAAVPAKAARPAPAANKGTATKAIESGPGKKLSVKSPPAKNGVNKGAENTSKAAKPDKTANRAVPAPATKPAAKESQKAVIAVKPKAAAPAAKSAGKKEGKRTVEVKAAVVVLAEPAPQIAEPEAAAPVARLSVPAMPPGPSSNGAIYYDSHMHTPLCKHAWGEPEEYAAQGVKAGMKGIIFTCHCPMPEGFWPIVRMADSEFESYVEMVNRTAKAFKGRLDVRLGLESEFFPGMEGWIEKLHQRAEFDYILGGLHWQAREYLAKFETGTIEAFRKCYFNHLAEAAETGLYDCLAHPDLVKNYHPDSWCLAIVKGAIATALDRIAATGVSMEMNTSGLNKSYSEMNPGMEMLRMMADRNIPVVIGSDAHRPHRVGDHFMTALSCLQEAGYSEVGYFLKRKRIDLKISVVQASIKKAADSQVS